MTFMRIVLCSKALLYSEDNRLQIICERYVMSGQMKILHHSSLWTTKKRRKLLDYARQQYAIQQHHSILTPQIDNFHMALPKVYKRIYFFL